MDYEVENRLNNRIDRLEEKNRQLENYIAELEKKIGDLYSIHCNRYRVIDQLLITLSEHPQLFDISNDIHMLRNEL